MFHSSQPMPGDFLPLSEALRIILIQIGLSDSHKDQCGLVRRWSEVHPKKLCLSYRLRLSLIGQLVILPFTFFSNLTNDNWNNLRNYPSLD